MRGLLKRFWAVSLSLATRTGGRRSDRLPFLSVCVALALIGVVAAPRAFAQFQPPVGPIGTVVTPNATTSQTHTGVAVAGVFTLTRATVGNPVQTIQYTVDRPGTLANVAFERTRPQGSTAGFDVTAAFVGDHGLIFRVFDADTVNVRNTVVFLDLSQSFPVPQNLYSRQDFVTDNANPQFFRDGGANENTATTLFTKVFLVVTDFPDTFELSVFRTDTGALFCNMEPQDRQTSDTFTANILDATTARIRHHTQTGDIDQTCPLPLPAQPQTTRVSLRTDGIQANGDSNTAAISGDGRFVAFNSAAQDLVENDTNHRIDTFVKDRTTGITTRVSVKSDGIQATGGTTGSRNRRISADGRFVAFQSDETNLVPGDSNMQTDIFVHDRTTHATTRVSVKSGGTEATGGDSLNPAISADGRFVAFESTATNLIDNDGNAQSDVFVHDRTTGNTTRVSVRSGGIQATGGGSLNPAISLDGRFVAFDSTAVNLVPNDGNVQSDVFLHDRTTGNTTRVSLSSNGTQGNGTSKRPAISGDGRFVAFASTATNLVPNDSNVQSDVFVHDGITGNTTRVSVRSGGTQATGGGSGGGFRTPISPDGRFVAFTSAATNLLASGNDTNGFQDVFIHDRTTVNTTRVSVSSDGNQATGGASISPDISGDARFVAFNSRAINLVNNDNNSHDDIFVRDRGELAVGTFDLAPSDLTVAVHERFNYAFTWTVPDPLNWHELQFLQLRIREGADTVLAVLWDEAGNTFRLLNAATGDYGPAFAPGTQQRLQTPQATLYLADTRVVGSGPTGPSVTLNLSLSLKPQTAGRTFLVEVVGSGDQGNANDFTPAGTLTVTP